MTTEPSAKAEMLIRRPVAEVFEAFVNPAITSKFWLTKGSGRLEPGKQLWVDRVPALSQAEIWLELSATDTAAAAKHLARHGVVRRDEIEPLPAEMLARCRFAAFPNDYLNDRDIPAWWSRIHGIKRWPTFHFLASHLVHRELQDTGRTR